MQTQIQSLEELEKQSGSNYLHCVKDAVNFTNSESQEIL